MLSHKPTKLGFAGAGRTWLIVIRFCGEAANGQSRRSSPHKTDRLLSSFRKAKMSTTMRALAPQARLGGKVSIKAPSQAKAFGLRARQTRCQAGFKCVAFTVTLNTPDGEQTVECDGELYILSSLSSPFSLNPHALSCFAVLWSPCTIQRYFHCFPPCWTAYDSCFQRIGCVFALIWDDPKYWDSFAFVSCFAMLWWQMWYLMCSMVTEHGRRSIWRCGVGSRTTLSDILISTWHVIPSRWL